MYYCDTIHKQCAQIQAKLLKLCGMISMYACIQNMCHAQAHIVLFSLCAKCDDGSLHDMLCSLLCSA